jgi:hypothetical protein
MSKIELLKEKADKLGCLVLVNINTLKGKPILPSTLPPSAEDEDGVYYTDNEKDYKNAPQAFA